MILIYLYLIIPSCYCIENQDIINQSQIEFNCKKDLDKKELLEEIADLQDKNFGKEIPSLILLHCDHIIRFHFPNINYYDCGYYNSYASNQFLPSVRTFIYNKTIDFDTMHKHKNSVCLDCKTLNFFDKCIKPESDDNYFDYIDC